MSAYNPDICAARGVHQALSSDVNIQMVLGPVPRLYDSAPEDPIYPYLTYGAMRAEDISGDDAVLTAHALTLHVWSRYDGRAEALDIIGHIRRVLEADDLSFDDAHLVSANVTYTDIFRSSDGRTLHGLVRVSLRTQPLDMETT